MPEFPGREEFWNVGYPLLGALVYLTALLAAGAIGWGLYRRVRLWRLGRPVHDTPLWKRRPRLWFRMVSREVLLHRRFLRHELYAGLMHLFLFWGIIVLFMGTVFGAVEFNWHQYLEPRVGFEFPSFHVRVQTGFVWDVFGGLMASVGVAMAVWRRYVMRPARLNTLLDDGVVLGIIAGLLLTGFLVEGLRILGTQLNPVNVLYDPSHAWMSPVGYLFALLFRAVGLTAYGSQVVHFVLWWVHVGLFVAGLAYFALRFTKLMHLFTSLATALLRPERAQGALPPVPDLEKAERFGAGDITDLTWKQLLELDACTNCGRCQDQCPASITGKALSPRKLIQDLRGYMERRGAQLLAARGQTAPPATPDMVATLTEEALWDCTTCRACTKACPVHIQHVDTIVEVRRHLTMERGSLPPSAQQALQCLEERGHPWRGTPFSRTDWAKDLGVPTMAEHPRPEVLFWVGCTAALEERSQAIARAMVKVLRAARVDFAILGEEERCTGDPARRMGHEYLFQTLARKNIETLERYGVRRIVTVCPHCFNTLWNEYPQLGGQYEVLHYTRFLDRLVKEGRLRLKRQDGLIAYHDSCYLGRHNNMYATPRRLVQAAGLRIAEMTPYVEERGLCCGAGGGHMWMEERRGQRINHLRAQQFLATGAPVLGVSCPFCLQMLTEGIEAKGAHDTRQARDLLELLAKRVEQGP